MPEEAKSPSEKPITLGPPQISIFTFLFKIIAGSIGGIIGTTVLILIFFLAQSILSPLSTGDIEELSVISIFIIMIMVFLSASISNILSSYFLSLTERKKYGKVSSSIYQIFMLNVIIFFLMIPVYLITAGINTSLMTYAVAIHLIISAQVSALILEIISNNKYALLGVYGVTFSILISAGILFAIASFINSPAILLFAALPVVWASIAFTLSLVTNLYGWIARTYDKDFLASDTLYGKDYGKQPEPEEEPEPKETKVADDEAGADFLRKQ